jgi:hypothetical protein
VHEFDFFDFVSQYPSCKGNFLGIGGNEAQNVVLKPSSGISRSHSTCGIQSRLWVC